MKILKSNLTNLKLTLPEIKCYHLHQVITRKNEAGDFY